MSATDTTGVWQFCPSCKAAQSYHGMNRCAYCHASEPSQGFYIAGYAAAAPSLPAVAGEPLNVTRIEQVARRIERLLDTRHLPDAGALRRDVVYLRSIAKPAVPCPACAEAIELRRALASRESRIGELENEVERLQLLHDAL